MFLSFNLVNVLKFSPTHPPPKKKKKKVKGPDVGQFSPRGWCFVEMSPVMYPGPERSHIIQSRLYTFNPINEESNVIS